MRKISKILLVFTVILTMFSNMTACGKKETNDDKAFLKESFENPLKNVNVGGSDKLALDVNDDYITLENKNIRVKYHKINGSIREIVNKQTKQYLVKNADSNVPFNVNYTGRQVNNGRFTFDVVSDTDTLKEIQFTWEIRNKSKLVVNISLSGDDDVFHSKVSLLGNVQRETVVSVEYPVIYDISTLYTPETDEFVSPVATGYIFKNPTENFNLGKFKGINREYGMYPSGWEYPMQFMAYISKNIGGFYIGTNDGGNTIKSFTFTGSGNDKIRASVYHFLDDISSGDKHFNYSVEIANLTKGYWQEAGERYYNFAKDQVWMKKGKLSERTDINKKLYENTVLANFGIRGENADSWVDRTNVYNYLTNTLNGDIFNIYLNSWQRNHYDNEFNSVWETFFPGNVSEEFGNQIKDAGDSKILFEFNTLFNAHYKRGTAEHDKWHKMAIRNVDNVNPMFSWRAGNSFREWWFMCPSVQDWKDFCIEKDTELLKTYGANGLYHDVGVAAVPPKQCYDTTHNHGTRVNIIEDYLDIEAKSKALSSEYGQHSVGQELIFEQLLPYCDFFQARANGGLLSWMESDRFRTLLEEDKAYKISLFDFVYHQYGGLRLDGFMMPVEELGEGYYYAMGFTALNGGIPEYNYEFLPFINSDEVYKPFVEFLNETGNARIDYGKEYLVYGKMKKAPLVNDERVTYMFQNSNVVQNGDILSGSAVFDKVIATAYESNGKIGIFLLNITGEDINSNFILEAQRFYGIDQGKVMIRNCTTGEKSQLCEVSKGQAKCSVTLPSRKVVMLEIIK